MSDTAFTFRFADNLTTTANTKNGIASEMMKLDRQRQYRKDRIARRKAPRTKLRNYGRKAA